MATTIVTKSGSGAPTASDLVAGELAVDLTNGRLYTENSGGTVLELGLNPNGNVNVTGSVTADRAAVYSGVLSEQSQIRFGYSSDYHWSMGRENASTGDLVIESSTTGTDTERLRILASGNIKQNSVNTSTNVGYAVNNGTYDAIALGTGGFGVNGGAATDGGIRAYNNLLFGTGASSTERMRLDSAGNVGIGVVPSAWGSGHRAIEIGNTGNALFSGTGTGATTLVTNNSYFNGSDWIYARTDQASHTEQNGGKFLWKSAASGTAGTAITWTSAMTLDASGNLLVGCTSAGASNGVTLHSSGYIQPRTNTGIPAIYADREGSDGSIIELRKDGAAKGSIGTTTSAGGTRFAIGAVGDPGIIFAGTGVFPASEITASDNVSDLGSASYRWKDLYLSGGVVFGTTGGSVSSKTLDDYEEGTWTPVPSRFTGGGITATYGTQAGYYTKVGNLVTCSFNIDIVSISSQGSNLTYISGLPYAPARSYYDVGATGNNTGIATVDVVSLVAHSDSRFYLRQSGNTSANSSAAWAAGALSGTITYMTS